MKKGLIRILVLIIVVSLALTAVSCKSRNTENGGPEATPSVTPAATTQNGEQEGTSGDNQPAEERYIPDLKGADLVLGNMTINLENAQKWDGGIMDPNFWGYLYTNRDYRWKEAIARVEKDTNCKIVILPSTDIPAMILEGNPPDLWQQDVTTGATTLVTLVEKGFVQPWDGVKGLDLSKAYEPITEIPRVKDWFDFESDFKDNIIWNSGALKAMNYKGKQYGLSGIGMPDWLTYNKEMIEAYGLEDPYELWKKDEWTWEKLREYMDVLTIDLTGDGQVDQFGLRNYIPEVLMASNKTQIVTYDPVKNEYNLNLKDKGFMEVLNYIYDITHKDNITTGGSIDKNTVAFDIRDTNWIGGTFGGMHMYYVLPVPFPKGPSADDYYCHGSFRGYYARAFPMLLPAGAKNPEGALYMVKAFFGLVYNYSYKIEHILTVPDMDPSYDYSDEDKAQMVEVYTYIAGREYNDNIRIFGLYDIINEMILDIRSNALPPETAIEKYRTQVEAKFEEMKNTK